MQAPSCLHRWRGGNCCAVAAVVALLTFLFACPYYISSSLVSLPGECAFATAEDADHRQCCGLAGGHVLAKVKTDRDCVWFWPDNCEWYGYPNDAFEPLNVSSFREGELSSAANATLAASTCEPHLVYWDVNSPTPTTSRADHHVDGRFRCYSDMIGIARLWNPTVLASGIGASLGALFVLCLLLTCLDPRWGNGPCCKHGWWISMAVIWLITAVFVVAISADQIRRGEKTTALRPHFSVEHSSGGGIGTTKICTLRFDLATTIDNRTSALAYLMEGVYLPSSFPVSAWRSPVLWTYNSGVEFTTYNAFTVLYAGISMLVAPFALLCVGCLYSRMCDRNNESSFYQKL